VGHRGWLNGPDVVEAWDVASGTLRATYHGHEAGVTALAVAPDGKLLVSDRLDRTVVLWDLTTDQDQTCVLMRSALVDWSLAFTPDGKTLAIATSTEDFRRRMPGTVALWDVATAIFSSDRKNARVHQRRSFFVITVTERRSQRSSKSNRRRRTARVMHVTADQGSWFLGCSFRSPFNTDELEAMLTGSFTK